MTVFWVRGSIFIYKLEVFANECGYLVISSLILIILFELKKIMKIIHFKRNLWIL